MLAAIKSEILRKNRMSNQPNPFAPPETPLFADGGEKRSEVWIWWVSGLLLLATMLNYMDRQTLSNLQVRIKTAYVLAHVIAHVLL